jgi:hypothetical protein
MDQQLSLSKEISLDEKTHKYKFSNNPDICPVSVTTLIKKWFNPFDEDEAVYNILKSAGYVNSEYYTKNQKDAKNYILRKWKEMRNNGTALHLQIQNYLSSNLSSDNGKPPESIEFSYFLNFLKKHRYLKTVVCEKIIFSSNKKVAGTIDCLMKDEEKNEYYLIDWKCSKEIKTSSDKTGFGPCEKVIDCNYNHYMLQLNIYRHILETNYGITIRRMWLINLHRNNKNYKRFSIQKYEVSDFFLF